MDTDVEKVFMMHTLLLFDDFFQYSVPDVAYMVGINIQQLPKMLLVWPPRLTGC